LTTLKLEIKSGPQAKKKIGGKKIGPMNTNNLLSRSPSFLELIGGGGSRRRAEQKRGKKKKKY